MGTCSSTIGLAAAAGLLATACAPSTGGAAAADAPPFDEAFAELGQRYGVEVRWDVGPGFFPPEWAGTEAHATRMSDPELQRMAGLLRTALAPYPEELLSRHLDRICLAGELAFFGHGYGGTYGEGSVFLSNEGEAAGFDDVYLVGTFHHELSSILMHAHGFETGPWIAENPASFSYASTDDGGFEAIANGEAGLEGSYSLYVSGLLTEYSKSELEEDFNIYCETMMTEPDRLRGLAHSYPRIAAKARLCREFYTELGIDVP